MGGRMLNRAYRNSIRTTQLLLQTINIGLGDAGLVGVVKADNTAQAQEGRDEHSQVAEALAGANVGVLLGTEDTENLIVLVDGLAKVALLLLVPPAAVGISVLTLHTGRVLVTAILDMSVNTRQLTRPAKLPRGRCIAYRTWRGSSISAARRAGIWEKDARGAMALRAATWGRRRARIRWDSICGRN